MENKYKYIEELTELFFDGATSNSQENELYVFFKNAKDLPEHLAPYKRMFGYFENGITPENEKTTGAGPIHIRPRRTALRKTAAAAAVLLLLAAIPLYLFNHQEKPDPYKGSYIRVGGVKTYDPAIVRAEWEDIRREVARKEMELEEMTRLPDIKTAAYSAGPVTESEIIMSEIRKNTNFQHTANL